jgi:hypothetical protein
VRSLTQRLIAAFAAIDAANQADPNVVTVRGASHPLAEIHGQLATEWVLRLRPDADDALLLAARAHHLRRWMVPRATYPEGRPGYLRWRKDQKLRHAVEVEAILREVGYDDATIKRVQALIRRDNLTTDADAQLMEDAACLVFLETQLTEMTTRVDDDRLIDIIRKTVRKMSPTGLAAVAQIELSAESLVLLQRAHIAK